MALYSERITHDDGHDGLNYGQYIRANHALSGPASEQILKNLWFAHHVVGNLFLHPTAVNCKRVVRQGRNTTSDTSVFPILLATGLPESCYTNENVGTN